MKIDHKEIFRNSLSIGVLAICFYLLWDIYHIPKVSRSDDASDVKMLCITTVALIVGYYFGSSVGSQKSGDTIRQMLNPSDGTTTVNTKSPTEEGQKDKPEGN